MPSASSGPGTRPQSSPHSRYKKLPKLLLRNILLTLLCPLLAFPLYVVVFFFVHDTHVCSTWISSRLFLFAWWLTKFRMIRISLAATEVTCVSTTTSSETFWSTFIPRHPKKFRRPQATCLTTTILLWLAGVYVSRAARGFTELTKKIGWQPHCAAGRQAVDLGASMPHGRYHTGGVLF